MTAHDRLHRAPTATDAHFCSDGVLIAGTLTKVPHPVAAALLITGSGKINRDSDGRLGRRGPVVLRTGVTRQVAEALATVNVAALGIARGPSSPVPSLPPTTLLSPTTRPEPRASTGVLRSFAQSPFGPWLLILAAPRPIAFGISSFVEAKWRRTLGGVPV